MSTRAHQSAFPVGYTGPPDGSIEPGTPVGGLSKRELLAGMAMQGILARYEVCFNSVEVAEYAVKYADALIKELNRV